MYGSMAAMMMAWPLTQAVAPFFLRSTLGLCPAASFAKVSEKLQ